VCVCARVSACVRACAHAVDTFWLPYYPPNFWFTGGQKPYYVCPQPPLPVITSVDLYK